MVDAPDTSGPPARTVIVHGRPAGPITRYRTFTGAAETTGTVSGSLDGKLIVVGDTRRTCAEAARGAASIATAANTADRDPAGRGAACGQRHGELSVYVMVSV